METERKKCIVMGCENHADEGRDAADSSTPPSGAPSKRRRHTKGPPTP